MAILFFNLKGNVCRNVCSSIKLIKFSEQSYISNFSEMCVGFPKTLLADLISHALLKGRLNGLNIRFNIPRSTLC